MRNIKIGLDTRGEGKPLFLAGIFAVFAVLAIACGSAATDVPDASSTQAPSAETVPPTNADAAAPAPTAEPDTPESPATLALIDLQSMVTGGDIGTFAPDFSGISAWINSSPLTMTQLQGKVVLVDFWTYTCINCIRTYPFLKLWNSRYSDDGLVIVGVHSPEFEFEKDYDNVLGASEKDGIVWPIAQDNEFHTWRSYSNQFWPAKYLVDKDGVIRYTHFGEGAYAETEEIIRQLLIDAGANLSDENRPLPADQMSDTTYLADFEYSRSGEVTRELYAGFERGRGDFAYGQGGYVHQELYYKTVNSIADFEKPDELDPHVIYFDGPWHIGAENVRHAIKTEAYDDSLSLVYSARSVNAVLTSSSGEPYRVRLTVDGEYLTGENKGTDVIINDDGESYLSVTDPKMYSIIENSSWVRRQELKMSSNSDDFSLFAFTFGIYESGP